MFTSLSSCVTGHVAFVNMDMDFTVIVSYMNEVEKLKYVPVDTCFQEGLAKLFGLAGETNEQASC